MEINGLMYKTKEWAQIIIFFLGKVTAQIRSTNTVSKNISKKRILTLFMVSVLRDEASYPPHTHTHTPYLPKTTQKKQNYLHKQPEWGLSGVEAVHRVILPFTPKRLWSQQGWHARTAACQGEYTASGSAQQTLSRSIQHTLQRNVILYGPFNTLQIHSPSITTAQTHNKATRANIGRPFLSVCPSFYLSDCLPVLWWEETNLCLHFELTRLPVPHCAGQRQPQSRPSKATEESWLFGIWSLATQLRVAIQETLTKCHLSGQIETLCKTERGS